MNKKNINDIGEPFGIGSLQVKNRILQAPMAGITGRACRMQARRFGAGLAYTEMISSYGIHYANRRTTGMLELAPDDHPVAVQLFGNSPGIMAEAAMAAEQAGADALDVNMGCSVRKVVKTGAGVALMRDEGLAAEIVAAMARSVRIPVMAKIRSGFSKVTAPSLARRLQEAGAAAISIHPRTGQQRWRGSADHAVTAALAAALDIPVIASGDIDSHAEAIRLLGDVGAAAVMLGRAALGNPWIYSDLLNGVEPHCRPLAEVLAEMEIFYRDVLAELGEKRALPYMRKFYGWYLSRLGASGAFKAALRQADSFETVMEMAQRELA